MKAAWLLLCFVTAVSPGSVQEKTAVEDFARSPTEHIINDLQQPFVVLSVEGSVIGKTGRQEPLPNVLVEIQGPDNDKKIRRATTDEHGRFKVHHVPAGTYRFKATLDGFQSVMGTIIVSKKAAKENEIKFEMPVGV